MDVKDTLSLISQLNKRFKRQMAYTLSDGAPCESSFYVDSGSRALNYAMTGDPKKGYPGGKLTILWGGSQSGKSLLAYVALANCQKAGGLAVLLDRESAANEVWMRGLGIDTQKLVYILPASVEEVFSTIEDIVAAAEEGGKKVPILVVWDSIASTPPAKKADQDYDATTVPGAKALAISNSMEKFGAAMARDQVACIFINQIRMKIGVTFGSPEHMPGGEALPFYASIILKLKTAKKLVDAKDVQHGVIVRPTIQKSRFRPTNDDVEIPLLYNEGVDDAASIVEMLSKYGVIEGKGHYTFTHDSLKEPVKFTKKTLDEKMLEVKGLEGLLWDALKVAASPSMMPGVELITKELTDEIF